MKRTLIVGAMAWLLTMGIAAPTSAAQRGQATMTWIGIPASASDEAIGGVTSASDASATCAFTNPAGLGRIERASVFLNHTSWLADMTINDLAVAYRVPNIGTFALSFRSMDYGDFTFTKLADNGRGYDFVSDDSAGTVAGTLIGLAYGRKLTDKFSIGGQIKYASDKLGKMDTYDRASERLNYGQQAALTAYLFDFGTSYHTGWKSLTINMTIQNFGASQKASNGVEEFTPPLTFKVGMSADALDLIGMRNDLFGLTIRTEGTDPRDDRLGFNAGGELRLKATDIATVAVRGGYSRRDAGGLTFGAGVGGALGPVRAQLDYAYSDWGGILGSVNRVGLGVAF